MTRLDHQPAAPREIQTRMFDSARWRQVALRDDDIVVATWAKSGTTLTQQIVSQLLSGGEERSALDASPWVDVRFMAPLPVVAAMLEAQTHRRFMKTHLPFYAVPFSPKVKYLYIGRDARDVIWSAHAHARSFTPAAWTNINAAEGPWPKWERPDPDVRAWYLRWLETDAAPGFHDLPFWPHVQGWWDQRRRPNVMLLHYANLIADLPGEIRRIAAFLDIAIVEARLPAIVEHCGIDHMRRTAGARMDLFFEKGAASFFNKGTNGRWRDVLSDAEIARCDAVAAARLSPDCAHWLKTGEDPAR
ncbi:MAG: sulfotransferase domain-containing protein [Caulobacteraceae bacterium]